MGPNGSSEWTCCFGLHVRTATILIGVWHLFLNVLSLGILAAIMRHPEMIDELEGNNEDLSHADYNDPFAPNLPTPQSKLDHSLAYTNADMSGILCMFVICSTLMLIYGASKYRPSHLLPFFCIQLFDFAITTLTAAGYLNYLRSIHHIIDQSHKLPWREEFLKLGPQQLSVIVLLVFISVIMLKAYTIGIVWRCYKYLTIRQTNLRSMLPYIIPDLASRPERDYNTLLPDYEEAIAQSMKQPPPPYYQVILTNPNDTTQTMTVRTETQTTSPNVMRNTAPPAYDEHTQHSTTTTEIIANQTESELALPNENHSILLEHTSSETTSRNDNNPNSN